MCGFDSVRAGWLWIQARHTFASAAADLDFSELMIATLLGHAAQGVTQPTSISMRPCA